VARFELVEHVREPQYIVYGARLGLHDAVGATSHNSVEIGKRLGALQRIDPHPQLRPRTPRTRRNEFSNTLPGCRLHIGCDGILEVQYQDIGGYRVAPGQFLVAVAGHEQ
jgi:hypothetical protein